MDSTLIKVTLKRVELKLLSIRLLLLQILLFLLLLLKYLFVTTEVQRCIKYTELGTTAQQKYI